MTDLWIETCTLCSLPLYYQQSSLGGGLVKETSLVVCWSLSANGSAAPAAHPACLLQLSLLSRRAQRAELGAKA